MIQYLTELTLLWVACWGLYALLLRREKFLRLNRAYLLLSFVSGLLLPLLDWSLFAPDTPWAAMPEIWLRTITVIPDGIAEVSATPAFPWNTWLLRAYLLGCGVAAMRLGYGLFTIYRYYRRGIKQRQDGVLFIVSEQAHAPFSWFNLLFWSSAIQVDSAERAAIIAHERAHIHQRHSLDVLLLEIVGIAFWWHPAWYAYRYELTIVHEYLADAAALQATPRRAYGQLLLRQCLRQPELPLVQPFHTSQLKKRIIMMTKSKSSAQALGKYALVLPLLLLLMFSVENVKAQQNTVPETADEVELIERIDTITVFDPATLQESVSIVKRKLYKKIPQMPVFGDCDHLNGDDVKQCSEKLLLTFIYENVKYPKAAMEAGQEGMALMSLVINTDGKVSEVGLLHGKTTEHNALNQEALRVARLLPDFKPGMYEGKPVSVQMVLPIKFKL